MLKALRHDGIGLSLYAKRLERGRFIWPATEGGASALTAGRMSWQHVPPAAPSTLQRSVRRFDSSDS
ncbi:IS66 family insertion sequence element accessory protein TnpB [Sinorhizobium meliloti]|uniref:IS66 family insertion sequence element accessory protein TnpB n=1 Tax=Rhizobium meliloti TaxID=382 RepID=UPI0009B706EC|nr:IS66 family insertion sequence element accessory protein TnpB [Sinorhizobium meliloti]ASP60086.1 hypothetical protein CDO30_09490 [Sinorhizobium meliloti]MCK3802094.1 IS66 family insertion sequence element accessory protein TnpB [Sinorhizobium meliloti]MCK3806073.1 IS66 family insertion sequence element accessory protein TnpB [Sinorhizobium meliloti]MCK3814156.1 IS66 family insertion sequence element accessory protein TnpB [Sinorhizobium meliloti]PTD30562.1 hypothetical protein C5N13_01975 